MSTVLRLRGPLSAPAIEAACARAAAAGSVIVVVERCDLSVVDAVGRLRLLARRAGTALRVVGADTELFDACGLSDLL
jgi:hypothetical protein